MNYWTIYMYTFPNGYRYVGATKQTLNARQGSDWRRYSGCTALWSAINEFGTDSIKQDILYEGYMDDSDAAKMEQQYIREYQTITHGYNRNPGGEGLRKTITTERREFLANQMRENGYARRGVTISDETRRRQSEAKIGKSVGPMSDETKRKIGRSNSLDHISEETRKRKSESHKQSLRATNQITGEELFFNCRDDAAEFFGVRSSAVSRWISGERNPSNGYVFENYSPTTTE